MKMVAVIFNDQLFLFTSIRCTRSGGWVCAAQIIAVKDVFLFYWSAHDADLILGYLNL